MAITTWLGGKAMMALILAVPRLGKDLRGSSWLRF